MRLRRIEVRDFRKLGHLAIEDLAPGLNVLVGDNEAGKSTLLAALRAALFERHRVGGKVLQAMLPHGQDVRPEISLDFEVSGAVYRLRKAFNQRPEAELQGPDGRVSGDGVEEALGRLLGFEAPGSRGSKPEEHQGVYGLLWVDQGVAHAAMTAGAGQGTLASALESEVGQVLGGGRGRHLLAAAEKRRDDYWDRRDAPKPRGGFRIMVEDVDRREGEAEALRTRLRRHDDKVVQLAARAEALQRHQRDDRLGAATRAAEAARTAMGRTRQLEATLADLTRTRLRTDEEVRAARERIGTRQGLASQAEAGRARAALAGAAAADAQLAQIGAERAAREALARLDAARAARDAAEAALAAAERALAGRRARDDLARTAARLAEVEAVAAARAQARNEAQAIALTAKDLADLDRLCAERDKAVLKRDAAGVQLTFTPLPGATAAADGLPLDTAQPLLLARDAVLELSGFGRLAVRPGGGATALSDLVAAAERHVADRLRQLGQADRQAVATLLARKASCEAEAASHDRVFAVMAPGGLDALRAEVETLQRAVGAAAPADAADATPDARAACEARRQEATAAERAATAANAAREAAARQAAVLGERAAAAGREADGASSALAAARAATDDGRLAAALAEAETRRALAEEAESGAAAALAAADPETAALALRRAEAAEQAVRQDIEALTRDKRDLEIELRTIGQEGLGELLDETEGRLRLRRRELESTRLEAEASLLLHRTLAAAQRDSKDRWLGPVRDRVRPYLKLIQPDSEIVLNEKTFSIEHLVRGGVPEPFETLSVGAREQVAVITRLALADILRTSGHPSAIILDDALVNTDESRLDRMHLVLQKAAETLQVIVLTCRERDFCTLGAPIRRL